jgi:hypothetical protein
MEQKSLGRNNNQQELFEVELGELKSLKENQIHIDELQKNQLIEKGQ